MQCPTSGQWGIAWCSVVLVLVVGVFTLSPNVGHFQTQYFKGGTRFEVVRLTNSSFQLLKDGEPFVVKGVCYSPMEINSDVNDAAIAPDPDPDSNHSHVAGSMFGDSFWDPPIFLESLEQALNPAALMQNWYGLWGSGSLGIGEEHSARGDLAKISQTLHANAVRVYFMQSRVYEETRHRTPKRPQDCQRRTHTTFLDEAFRNGLYVLVGLPLPIEVFHADDYKTATDSLIEWWEFVLAETVAEVGNHPAILGFTVMNELDDEPNAFPGQGANPKPDSKADFWHNQVVKYASIVKAGAPDKLVGWALHDCPSWLGFASNAKPSAATELLTTDSTYLEQISSVFDYYGVNTYQSQSLMSVLGHWGDHDEIGSGGKAYGAPSIAAHIKPVLFTEIGWPATGRTRFNDSASMMVDNTTTQIAVVGLMNDIFPQIYDEFKNLCIGAFYFEYTDEWWKTPKALAAIESLAGPWYHDGGNNCENLGFPNMCNDEESFGLYSRVRSGGRSVNSSNFNEVGIVLPVDELVARSPMVDALAGLFASNLTVPPQLSSLPYTSAAAIPRTPRSVQVSSFFLSCLCMLMLCMVCFFLPWSIRADNAVEPHVPSELVQPFLQVL